MRKNRFFMLAICLMAVLLVFPGCSDSKQSAPAETEETRQTAAERAREAAERREAEKQQREAAEKERSERAITVALDDLTEQLGIIEGEITRFNDPDDKFRIHEIFARAMREGDREDVCKPLESIDAAYMVDPQANAKYHLSHPEFHSWKRTSFAIREAECAKGQALARLSSELENSLLSDAVKQRLLAEAAANEAVSAALASAGINVGQ